MATLKRSKFQSSKSSKIVQVLQNLKVALHVGIVYHLSQEYNGGPTTKIIACSPSKLKTAQECLQYFVCEQYCQPIIEEKADGNRMREEKKETQEFLNNLQNELSVHKDVFKGLYKLVHDYNDMYFEDLWDYKIETMQLELDGSKQTLLLFIPYVEIYGRMDDDYKSEILGVFDSKLTALRTLCEAVEQVKKSKKNKNNEDGLNEMCLNLRTNASKKDCDKITVQIHVMKVKFEQDNLEKSWRVISEHPMWT